MSYKYFAIMAAMMALALVLKNKYQNDKNYDPVTIKNLDPSVSQIQEAPDTDPFNNLVMQQLTDKANQLGQNLAVCEQELAKFTGNSLFSSRAMATSIQGMRAIIDETESAMVKCQNDLNIAKSEKNHRTQLRESLTKIEDEFQNILGQLNQCRRSQNYYGFAYPDNLSVADLQIHIANAENRKADLTMQLRECLNSSTSSLQRETAGVR